MQTTATPTTPVLPAAPAPTPTDTQPPQTSRDSPAPSSSSANGGGVAAAGHHRQAFRSGFGSGGYSRGASYDGGDACREIYVKNLPDDITKDELTNVFSSTLIFY